MSKEIRILTGLHAGARLSLGAGIQCIGKDNNAKVRISDWDSAELWIDVSVDDEIHQVNLDSALEDASQLIFRNFDPRRFGDIVIAFGDEDAKWPSDLELLEQVFRPPTPQVTTSKPKPVTHKVVKVWSVVLAICVTFFGITVTSAKQFSEPKAIARNAYLDTIPKLRECIKQHNLPELEIHSEGKKLTLKGFINSSVELQNILQELNKIAPNQVQPKVTVVSDVLENLKSSVGDSNLTFQYMGNGIFNISGTTPQAEKDQNILNRLREDLGTNLIKFELHIQPADEGFPKNTDIAVQTETMQYVQTSDGIRHFTSMPEN